MVIQLRFILIKPQCYYIQNIENKRYLFIKKMFILKEFTHFLIFFSHFRLFFLLKYPIQTIHFRLFFIIKPIFFLIKLSNAHNFRLFISSSSFASETMRFSEKEMLIFKSIWFILHTYIRINLCSDKKKRGKKFHIFQQKIPKEKMEILLSRRTGVYFSKMSPCSIVCLSTVYTYICSCVTVS